MTTVMIHFQGGQSTAATIKEQDLGYSPDQMLAVRDYVEKALNAPSRPHWVWIGDVYVFSQAVSGVVPIDIGEGGEI